MLKIPPDSTFVVQMLVFAALFLVLRQWWFEPVLRVIDERRRRSEGAVAEARAIEAEVERLRAQHAAALAETRARAHHEMQEALRRAEAEQSRIIEEATEASQKALTVVREQIAREVAAARRGLDDQVDTISKEIARVIVGRVV